MGKSVRLNNDDLINEIEAKKVAKQEKQLKTW